MKIKIKIKINSWKTGWLGAMLNNYEYIEQSNIIQWNKLYI
jgi:hypothetical protein